MGERRTKTPNLVWISLHLSCGILLIITTTQLLSVVARSSFVIWSVTISLGWKMRTLWFRVYVCFILVLTPCWKSWTWAIRDFCYATGWELMEWHGGWSLSSPKKNKADSEFLFWLVGGWCVFKKLRVTLRTRSFFAWDKEVCDDDPELGEDRFWMDKWGFRVIYGEGWCGNMLLFLNWPEESKVL